MVKLDQDFGSAFSGVLVDAGDRLRALWASYSEQVNSEDRELCAGLPTAVFAPFVRRIAAAEADFPVPSAGVCQVSPSSTTVVLELLTDSRARIEPREQLVVVVVICLTFLLSTSSARSIGCHVGCLLKMRLRGPRCCDRACTCKYGML